MDKEQITFRSRPFLMIGAGMITGLAWPLLHQQSAWMPGLIASALGLADWLLPRQISPLWRCLERIGKAVAHYNGILLLSLAYFLIITPVGIFSQRRSRSRMDGRLNDSLYENPEGREAGHMRRMF